MLQYVVSSEAPHLTTRIMKPGKKRKRGHMYPVLFKNQKIRVGNAQIDATVIGPRMRRLCPAVIFIHGWRSKSIQHYRDRAADLAEQGIVSLVFSLRGHGESDGDQKKVTRADHLKDVLAAYNFLQEDPRVDKSRIGVFGTSYGCYLAMLLSKYKKVSWLILRAPALYRDSGFNLPTDRAVKALRGYRRQKVNAGRNLALSTLRDFSGDVLVVAGEADEDVPQRTIMNVLEACQAAHSVECVVVRGVDHQLSEQVWRNQVNELTDRWIIERSNPNTRKAR
ncbi:MAG: alpha/beta fold hydrolase [Patescibacteria group bacterium]